MQKAICEDFSAMFLSSLLMEMVKTIILFISKDVREIKLRRN